MSVKRKILSIISGSLLALTSALLGFFLVSLISSQPVVMVLSILLITICPFAGGFLAGLVAREELTKIGLISGLISGALLGIAVIIVTGYSLSNLLTVVFIMIIWGFLSRLGTTLSRPRLKK